MSVLYDNCCICMNDTLTFKTLADTDESSISLLTKLQTNVPEVEWQITFQICESCTNLLNIVHCFRETCVKSDSIRRNNISKQDIKNEDDLFHTSTDIPASESEHSDDEPKCETNDPDYTVTCINTSKRKRKVFRFPCEHCDNCFTSSPDLVRHCVVEHDMKAKNVRPFSCNRCNSRFANSSNLMQHIKYHDAVRSNMCTYCGKGFITKTDLNIHEKQHLNKREYKCEMCGKCFNTHKDVRSHKLVVHTDPLLWKYFCEICTKRFPIKSNYDCHMRRHTGDKKFECHLCNKKFTDKCVLQRHMRTHSNVREYKCVHCEREYKDKRVMQIHMAKIHGIGIGDIKIPSKERKYICHICPKAYFAKNKLTRHLYTHSGEKPFFCTVCNKKFNDKSYVKQHMRKAHNVKYENDDNDIKRE